eukprot:jgi/Mesen1/7063/ME000369S06388
MSDDDVHNFAVLAGTIILGAVGYYGFSIYSRRQDLAKKVAVSAPKGIKVKASLKLLQSQMDWLASMAGKHNLPDADKVLRIVITYAQNVDVCKKIFSKETGPSDPPESPSVGSYTLEDFHVVFLQEMAGERGLADTDQAARSILQYVVTKSDEATVFGIKRCKHGATCASCT